MAKECNVVATHLAERKIAISIAEAGPFREVQPPDTRIVKFRNDGSCVIGAPVTDNEKFPLSLGLRHYRPNGEGQHIGAIMSRCEDAEFHPPRGLSNLYGILSVSGGSQNLSGSA